MFSARRIRLLLTLIGLLAIGVIIWLAGPYFAFGTARPLESAFARCLAIGLVFLGWFGWRLFKRYRGDRATDALMGAVVEQSAAEQPSAEIVQLRERFEDAVSMLKQGRRSGYSLYELPWYIIIGAPGSGKTTALLNAGLKFPTEQRMGPGALRGVGGTRSCDWWFTDEAVFLDTAGRYTTQDSDPHADSAAWAEFLALLRSYRERRPINGVLLAISAQDLVQHGDAQVEAHVAAARRRLDELGRELQVQLPVYVLVTKCDLVSGFSEYFGDLTREDRSQVWGTTFNYDRTLDGSAARTFPREFDALVERLNARILGRLEDESDPTRRTTMFAFPQQFATMRDPLTRFVADVFDATRFDRRILLRGVYFTSGTQEGTPIDRLMSAFGRRFALGTALAAPSVGRGKAFFIERLLKEVVLGESGLAGVNRKLARRERRVQRGALVAVGVVAMCGLWALTHSYQRNRDYLVEVGAAAAALDDVPPVYVAASPESLLPRLDALRSVVGVAERPREESWWTRLMMRWGLYQGGAIGDDAREAYLRELSRSLLPQVAGRVERRLVDYQKDPTQLFLFLKAYLMLGMPERLDREELAGIIDLEWETLEASDPYAARALLSHFHALLDLSDELSAMPIDDLLVEQARSSIQSVSVPEVMFHALRARYGEGALRLDQEAGAGSTRVLRRRSGVPLSEPVPALFTASVFRHVVEEETEGLERRFLNDRWVWGDQDLPAEATRGLGARLVEIYEREYIAYWDEALRDIEPVAPGSQRETEELLLRLSGPASPLRALLQTVSENTLLVEPSDAEESQGLRRRATDLLGTARGALGVRDTPPHGSAVTAHFAELHDVVIGDRAAQLDDLLGLLGAIHGQLEQLGPSIGDLEETSPEAQRVRAEIVNLSARVRGSKAALPDALGPVVDELAGIAGSGPSPGPALARLYRRDVLSACTALMGRYPFTATGDRNAVTLGEFGRVFGDGGPFDRFFRQQLQALVDVSRAPWRWRPGAGVASREMLRTVEEADRIRDLFFGAGGTVPSLSFDIDVLGLEGPAERFVLTIGDQTFDFLRGSLPPRGTASWPGAPPYGASFRFGSAEQREGGEWGWFKLLQLARKERVTVDQYDVVFWNGPNQARVRVETAGGLHPVAALDQLQRFRCRG